MTKMQLETVLALRREYPVTTQGVRKGKSRVLRNTNVDESGLGEESGSRDQELRPWSWERLRTERNGTWETESKGQKNVRLGSTRTIQTSARLHGQGGGSSGSQYCSGRLSGEGFILLLKDIKPQGTLWRSFAGKEKQSKQRMLSGKRVERKLLQKCCVWFCFKNRRDRRVRSKLTSCWVPFSWSGNDFVDMNYWKPVHIKIFLFYVILCSLCKLIGRK